MIVKSISGHLATLALVQYTVAFDVVVGSMG
jgi:hypothetical protein